MKKEEKMIRFLVDDKEIDVMVGHINSVSMHLVPRTSRPTVYFNFGYSGKSFVCRNENTVGCMICGIGTFINSEYQTHMSIKPIMHPDKSHVVQFIVETWHDA